MFFISHIKLLDARCLLFHCKVHANVKIPLPVRNVTGDTLTVTNCGLLLIYYFKCNVLNSYSVSVKLFISEMPDGSGVVLAELKDSTCTGQRSPTE